MSVFTIVCAIILIILAGIFMNKTKKEEVKPEVVIPKKQIVLIEVFPKGTSNNPYITKVNREVLLECKGYSDYKKETEVKLNDGNCSWHKSCAVGSFAKEYGVTNIYYTPSVAGKRDLWCSYNDGKLRTSASLKLLVEV